MHPSMHHYFFSTLALCRKEILRFLKVYHQTIVSPIVTALLYLAVFVLCMGGHASTVGDVPFGYYMSAGLMIMTTMQSAFSNTSSVLIMGKVLGTLVDYLMPPFSAFQLLLGLVVGSVARAIITGLLLALCLYCFYPLQIMHPGLMLFFFLSTAIILALMGVIAGIFAETFDQMAAITNYLITPLSFLSGTFYSTHHLPVILQKISHANPLFYMIDGFRYSMTGYHESNLTIGILFLSTLTVGLWLLTHRLLHIGYRIKH